MINRSHVSHSVLVKCMTIRPNNVKCIGVVYFYDLNKIDTLIFQPNWYFKGVLITSLLVKNSFVVV